MADPLSCLRGATLAIAIWNIIYCFVQFGVLGWQVYEVKYILYEFDSQKNPPVGYVEGISEYFPALRDLYVQTPNYRRYNAMYILVIISLAFSVANLLTSILLFFAAYRHRKSLILPWFATSIPLCIMTTIFAVLWWGTNETYSAQLSMSIFEFVTSVAINALTIIVVVIYYARLDGALASTRPRHSRKRKKKRVQKIFITSPRRRHRHEAEDSIRAAPYIQVDNDVLFPKRREEVPVHVPNWRRDWPEIPDPQLQRKLKMDRLERMRRSGLDVPRGQNNEPILDFYAPEADDPGFPWKLDRLEAQRSERKMSQAERIAQLYYQEYPESIPDIPVPMRRRMRLDKEHQQQVEKKFNLKPDDRGLL